MRTFLYALASAGFILSCIKAPGKVTTNHDSELANSAAVPDMSADAEVSASDAPSDAQSSQDPLFTLHNPKPQACGSCHENKRPTPNHYAGMDCSSCHNYPSFKPAQFSHMPKPASCEGCHARPATVGLRAYPNEGPPAGFNAADANAVGGGHYRGKECAACHLTPAEGSPKFAFNHSSPKADFCLPCHFNRGSAQHVGSMDVMLAGNGNCFSCHKNFDAKAMRNWTPLNGDE